MSTPRPGPRPALSAEVAARLHDLLQPDGPLALELAGGPARGGPFEVEAVDLICALGAIRAPEAGSLLRRALAPAGNLAASAAIAKAAAETLVTVDRGNCGQALVGALISGTLEDGARSQVAEVVARHAPTEVEGLLLDTMTLRLTTDARCRVVRALGGYGSERTGAVLNALLEEKGQPNEVVAEAVRSLGPKVGVERLAGLIGSKTTSVAVRVAAAEVAAGAGSSEAVTALDPEERAVLRDSVRKGLRPGLQVRPMVGARPALLRALVALGLDDESTAILEKATVDRDPATSACAMGLVSEHLPPERRDQLVGWVGSHLTRATTEAWIRERAIKDDIRTRFLPLAAVEHVLFRPLVPLEDGRRGGIRKGTLAGVAKEVESLVASLGASESEAGRTWLRNYLENRMRLGMEAEFDAMCTAVRGLARAARATTTCGCWRRSPNRPGRTSVDGPSAPGSPRSPGKPSPLAGRSVRAGWSRACRC